MKIKQKRCVLCDWKGRTQWHHIIPIKDHGEDNENNIIELCPNHHAEATNKEEEFRVKYSLVGERFSDNKEDFLIKAGCEYHRLLLSDFFLKCSTFMWILEGLKKNKLDFDDLLAQQMGITKKTILRHKKEMGKH